MSSQNTTFANFIYKEMQGVASSQAMSEVDVIIRDLKAQRGFSSYMIMNNDGRSDDFGTVPLLSLMFFFYQ